MTSHLLRCGSLDGKLFVGECKIPTGGATKHCFDVKLADLAKTCGIGPGDKIFVAAAFKINAAIACIGEYNHYWGVDAGKLSPPSREGMNDVIPHAARQNSALRRNAPATRSSVLKTLDHSVR